MSSQDLPLSAKKMDQLNRTQTLLKSASMLLKAHLLVLKGVKFSLSWESMGLARAPPLTALWAIKMYLVVQS
jgi:hypothetical protein